MTLTAAMLAAPMLVAPMLTAMDWLRHTRRKHTMSPDLALGRRGEDLAQRLLRRRGYTIVARNYRLHSGDAEADIIAYNGEDLVFVEVKTRESAEHGPPDRAVGFDKQRHLRRVALEYTRSYDVAWERVRFDVVTVVMTRPPEITLFRGAFSSVG
jgi:putative endonuclease